MSTEHRIQCISNVYIITLSLASNTDGEKGVIQIGARQIAVPEEHRIHTTQILVTKIGALSPASRDIEKAPKQNLFYKLVRDK